MFKKRDTTHCPKCHSTNLKIEKHGEGMGMAFMATASIGRMNTPGVGPGGLASGVTPLPTKSFDNENFVSNRTHITCLDCGHQYWIKNK